MFKVYFLKGGAVITATSPEQFVERMRDTAFNSNDTPSDYMRAVSTRCAVQSNAVIRCDSAQNFIADLQHSGYILHVVALN